MPKPLKFPGLQPKFEKALQTILAKEALSGSDIREELKAKATEFELAGPELADLLVNFANYIARAKEADLVRSGGPWAGYQLSRVNPPPLVESPRAPVEEERIIKRPTEAAMHFVATCGLSINFGSRVASLPTTVDTIAWGNADMLMLRGNPSRQRLEDSSLDPEILKLADSSPECILSSIELKYGLERNRRSWFQAVAEAAANSRWANESLLVHVSPEPQPAALDDEVVSLSRSAEIGILEISALRRDGRRSLETRVIVAPPLRPFLRLAELSGNRVGLLREAHELLRAWNQPVVTFLDEEGAPRKLLRLLRQAIANLRRQPNFGSRPLVDSLGLLAADRAVPSLFMAALDTIATSTDAAANLADAMGELTRVGSETLTKKQWDEFSTDMAGLQKLLELARPATD